MFHKILKDFDGSQDGRFCETFKAGTERDLTPYLAAIVVPEGWAEPVKTEPTLDQAIESAAVQMVPGGDYFEREDYVVNGISDHYKANPEEVRSKLLAAFAPHKAGAEQEAADKAAAEAAAAGKGGGKSSKK